MEESAPSRKSRLDGWAARALAGLLLLGVLAALLAIHWEDLFPGEGQASADPAAACIAQRKAEVARMIAETPSMESRRALFEERAEAFCRATAGGGSQ